MCCLNGNVHLIQFNNFFIQARGPTWLVLWNTKTVYHEKINIKASSSKLWLQRKSIDFLQKLNSMSSAVFALRPWYQCSRQLLGFSGSQRAPRTSRAHSPAAARRNPGPGCRVPSVGPRPATTGAPERRKMRGYTFCRGGVYADQLTSSRSASDDAFSVATNHRQINRYIVDSILQYI